MQRLAVVGDPIAHSLSPALQAAAADALGLDWSYERRRVAAGELARFVDVLDERWLGLSVTAPLKEEARALSTTIDAAAELTGAVNTLLLGPSPRGWNTDVGGMVQAFTDAGLGSAAQGEHEQGKHEQGALERGVIIGAGATAQAALLALAKLGARHVTAALRTPAKGARLVELGERIGVEVALAPLGEPVPAVDAAVSTLPAAADVVPAFTHPPTRLLDADYARTDGSRYLATLGAERVIDGREMLLGQALLQARIFAQGEVDAPLPEEARVVAAMRAAMQ